MTQSAVRDSIKKIIEETIQPRIDGYQRYLVNSGDNPLLVSRKELLYVWDDYHNQYLDFDCDMYPIGHRHPLVMNAIRDHLEYYTSGPVDRHNMRYTVEYAQMIEHSFDDAYSRRVLFTEGEHEAVMAAISLAQASTERNRVLMTNTDTHNWISMNMNNDIAFLENETIYPNIRPDTAALLISLVDNAGHPQDVEYLREAVASAKRVGAVVIVDESRTGFGRTGTLWAQTNAGITADITVLGGPVGGGFPLGALVTDLHSFDEAALEISPQAGNPLACAAGKLTLGLIVPELLEHVRSAAEVMDDALKEVVNQFPEQLITTYGIGMLRSLIFKDRPTAHNFVENVRQYGLLVNNAVGGIVTLSPPLIASTMELKRGIDLIASALID